MNELLNWLDKKGQELGTHQLVVGCAFFAQQFIHYQKQSCSRLKKEYAKPSFEMDCELLLMTPTEELHVLFMKWLETRQFRKVIPNAHLSLHKLINNIWPAAITTHIPTPLEVLKLQTEGLRVVTVLTKAERVLLPVLTKQHALEFMLHDLEHLYKFEFDPQLKKQQMHLAKFILHSHDLGFFDEFLQDSSFQDKFDYLASDMNTHPMHSLQYMKAFFLEYLLRSEGHERGGFLSPDGEQRYDQLMKELAMQWGWKREAIEALTQLNRRPLNDSECEYLMSSFQG
ncbi:MAG: hypothetical protein COW00_10100 [Bdellovibrio sp. CG12_big_fil_rev_8_21_14_0_65_39_13]|nr:MAG: hypothetical protein COW78_01215 [Bdellovibrio sp. CG22_combo_CG10-13_8_21_14_all_39_27]PIQ59463.1 MAG: hypothetical protein COW00_10100 [Bdellovibrio sp. CG12_big_fil_rev_8_21_14_0_65_39_13]PIR36593.1 MAG: hypothetical protein COV37_02830 [Bdellovibrio sp. CG11_big_fil_rev_8_21_14_0_20_39_38]